MSCNCRKSITSPEVSKSQKTHAVYGPTSDTSPTRDHTPRSPVYERLKPGVRVKK